MEQDEAGMICGDGWLALMIVAREKENAICLLGEDDIQETIIMENAFGENNFSHPEAATVPLPYCGIIGSCVVVVHGCPSEFHLVWSVRVCG